MPATRALNPEQEYEVYRATLSLSCALYTIRLDADAPLKLVVDTVAAALGIDDRQLGALVVRKIPVRRRADQRLELWAEVRPVADAGEFAALSGGVWVGMLQTRLCAALGH